MNIKSLLLGSAAALVAVSGARAADAVVMVEPEPVEYVRVCDVYGTGFFYIPGTETCLKIGGYVRVRFLANDQDYTSTDLDGRDDYRFTSRVRGRVDFDAREETELGTLRSKIRFEGTNRSSNASGDTTTGNGVEAREAFIQLGGLTIGYMDSAWTHNDGGIEDGLLMEESDFAAGDFRSNRISYTYAAKGFSGTVSLEDDGDGDVTPDVIGKLAYTGKFGGAYLLGVYDEDSANFSTQRRLGDGPNGSFGRYDFFTDENSNNADEGAVVVKGGLLLKDLIADGGTFKVEGHYAFDPSIYARVDTIARYDESGSGVSNFNNGLVLNGGRGNLASEYQIGAAYSQKFGKLTAGIAGAYGETFDQRGAFTDLSGLGQSYTVRDLDAADYYGVAGNLSYKVTSNFQVLGELSYVDIDLPAGIDTFDQTRGFLEFKRNF